jgi:hypothetical protein
MTPQQRQRALERNRFILVHLARIGPTIVALLGILLWKSDSFVRGGSIVGLPITLLAMAASFTLPQWLARRWRTPPAPRSASTRRRRSAPATPSCSMGGR